MGDRSSTPLPRACRWRPSELPAAQRGADLVGKERMVMLLMVLHSVATRDERAARSLPNPATTGNVYQPTRMPALDVPASLEAREG